MIWLVTAELLEACPCTLLCTALVLFLSYQSFITVRRGERALLRNRFSGSVRLLDAGLHLCNPVTEVLHSTHPWTGILNKRGSGRCAAPAPGSRVVLDPQPSMLHTKERVPGSVDVAVEATVLPWALDVLSEAVPFRDNANRRVKRWVCQALEGLAADDFSFGHLAGALNTPAALEALNEALGQFHLRAECVHLDPGGVRLDPKHIAARQTINLQLQAVQAERRQLQRQAEVEEARRTNAKTQLEFELRQKQLTQDARLRRETAAAQHAVELARLRAQAATQAAEARAAAVASLIGAGLSPTDVASMQIAEAANAAVKASGASTTLLAIPPGMLGLSGLQGFGRSAAATGDTAAGGGFVAVRPAGDGA